MKMTLQEYYNFPEGVVPQLKRIPHWLEENPNFPCPSDMTYAFAYYKGTSIPELDTSNVTNMSNMFNHCENLTSLDVNNWDTSKVTTMRDMFYYCVKLTLLDLSSWDTSKVTDMNNMFYYCSNLTSLDLSSWDTSKVTNMSNMFNYCINLTSMDVSNLDTSKVTNMGNMFSSCSKLETLSSINCGGITGTDSSGAGLFGYSGLSSLKNFGGWINLKKSVTNYGINKCPNLTYESCINVLNGLYDFVGNQTTPASNEGKLKVHSNFLTLVGDEISIGTNKGWTITA